MVKISVIMPVYNKQKYVDRSIASVLQQSFQDFELIVIDDGSTDQSGKIIDAWAEKDNRIRVYHIQNGGVSNARNLGLDKATGVYITFIDADDTVGTSYLETLYDCIEQQNVDFVISSFKKVWEDSEREENEVMPVKGKWKMEEVLPFFTEWQKQSGIFGYCCSKIFRKELVKNTKFDTNLTLAEDFDFYLKLYKKVKMIYFDDAKNYYYLQEAENCSVKSDYEIDYWSQLKINIRYKDFLKSQNAYSDENKINVDQQIINYCFFTLFYCDLTKFEEVFWNVHNLCSKEQITFNNQGAKIKLFMYLMKKCHYKLMKIILQTYRYLRKKR